LKDIKAMNEVLKLVSEEENNNRKKYDEVVSGLIPMDLKKGLEDQTPIQSVQIISFDEHLPKLSSDQEQEEEKEEDWQNIDQDEDKVEKFGDISKLLSKSYFGTDSLVMRNLSESTMLQNLSSLVRITEEKKEEIKPNVAVETVKSKTDLMNEEISQLKKIIEQLNANEFNLKDELIKQEKESFRKESEMSTEISQLKETLELKEKEIAEFKKMKEEEVQWAKEQMNKETFKLSEHQKQSKQDVEKAINILNETKEREKKAQEMIQSLTTENKTLSLSVQNIQKNNENLIAKNKKLEADVNLLKSQTSTLSTALSQTKSSKDAVSKELETAKYKLQTLSNKDKENEKELNTLKYESQNLKENISHLKKKEAEIENSLKSLKFENEKIKNQWIELNGKFSDSNKLNQQLKFEKEELLNKENSYKRSIEDLSKVSDSATNLRNALENERKNAQLEMKKLKENFERQTKEINEQDQKEIKQLKNTIHDLEMKVMNVESNSSSDSTSEKKIQQLNLIVSNATSIISSKTQEITKLNTNYVQVEKLFKDSKDLLDKLENENTKFVKEICTSNELHEIISGLGNQIKNTKNVIDSFLRILSPLCNVQQVRTVIGQLTIKYQPLEGIYNHLFKISKKIKTQNTISISNFDFGDKVIFFKKSKDKNLWECFNVETPHYYLDEDSIQAVQEKYKDNSLMTVTGMIIAISKVNTKEDARNPFKLNHPYSLVTITLI
jgi:chromosome segregation ATPase